MSSDTMLMIRHNRKWNTSKVTDMRNMFNGATSANPDVSGWDTSKVTDMSVIFGGAILLFGGLKSRFVVLYKDETHARGCAGLDGDGSCWVWVHTAG